MSARICALTRPGSALVWMQCETLLLIFFCVDSLIKSCLVCLNGNETTGKHTEKCDKFVFMCAMHGIQLCACWTWDLPNETSVYLCWNYCGNILLLPGETCMLFPGAWLFLFCKLTPTISFLFIFFFLLLEREKHEVVPYHFTSSTCWQWQTQKYTTGETQLMTWLAVS